MIKALAGIARLIGDSFSGRVCPLQGGLVVDERIAEPIGVLPIPLCGSYYVDRRADSVYYYGDQEVDVFQLSGERVPIPYQENSLVPKKTYTEIKGRQKIGGDGFCIMRKDGKLKIDTIWLRKGINIFSRVEVYPEFGVNSYQVLSRINSVPSEERREHYVNPYLIVGTKIEVSEALQFFKDSYFQGLMGFYSSNKKTAESSLLPVKPDSWDSSWDSELSLIEQEIDKLAGNKPKRITLEMARKLVMNKKLLPLTL